MSVDLGVREDRRDEEGTHLLQTTRVSRMGTVQLLSPFITREFDLVCIQDHDGITWRREGRTDGRTGLGEEHGKEGMGKG